MKEKYLLIKVPKEQKGCEGCPISCECDVKDNSSRTTCPIYNGVEVEEVEQTRGVNIRNEKGEYVQVKLFALKEGK